MIYNEVQVGVNLLEIYLEESNRSCHFYGGGKSISLSDYAWKSRAFLDVSVWPPCTEKVSWEADTLSHKILFYSGIKVM